jgi:hypothetical protein
LIDSQFLFLMEISMWFDSLIFNETFVAGAFFLLGVFFFIPLIVRSFLRWKQTKKPQDFSNGVMAVWIFIFLIIPSYCLLLRNIHQFQFQTNSAYFSLFNAILFGAIFYFLIPIMVHFYIKFKSGSRGKDLGMMIFLMLLTFYALSLQLSLFLKSFIDRWGSQ